MCQTASPFFHLQQMLLSHCKTCSDEDRHHHSSNTITSPRTHKPAIFSLACCLSDTQQAVLRDQFAPSEKLAETVLRAALFSHRQYKENLLLCLPETDSALPRSGKMKETHFLIKITEQFVTMHSILCTTKASVRQF